jgi:hypothetical protein
VHKNNLKIPIIELITCDCAYAGFRQGDGLHPSGELEVLGVVKNTKIGNREMFSMAKINTTINLFASKSWPLRAASMAKRMRLFSGAEGMY